MPYGQPLGGGGLPSSVRPSARSTTRAQEPAAPSSSRARSVGRPSRYNDDDDDRYAPSSSSSRPPPLPSNPRVPSARSRSVGRQTKDYDNDDQPSSRPSRDRSRAPGLPTGPQASGRSTPSRSQAANDRPTANARVTRDRERYRPAREERDDYERDQAPSQNTRRTPRSATPSMSSTSSGASSLFDRTTGGRGGRSVASSARTSLDEDEGRPSTKARGVAQGGQGHRGGRRGYDEVPEGFDERDDGRNAEQGIATGDGGYGFSLWGRIAEAASSLTINVSKAWEQGVTKQDGEDTPEGQESRLTVAMKQYHLERARTPADLPKWLFSDLERRGGGGGTGSRDRRREDEAMNDVDDYYYDPEVNAPKGGSRDRNPRTGAAPAPRRPRAIEEPSSDATGGGTKATNRLKALREEKRRVFNAPAPAAPSRDNRSYSYEDDNGEGRSRDNAGRVERGPRGEPAASGTLPPTRRIGLPSGPRRGGR